MSSSKPLVLLKPEPQLRDRIFTAETLARLNTAFEVIDYEANPDDADFQRRLPEAFAVVGQPALDTAALEAATNLHAIVNVEGNFFPNVDYATAFRNGVRVLGCGTAYSQAVAEYSVGLALDIARSITREDRAARSGSEGLVSESTGDSILLRRASVGLVGFGNLGRATKALLEPFDNTVRVFDPWLPTAILEDAGVIPSTLEETLSQSTFVFVFATATAESEHLLNAEMLSLLPDGARLILVSRAAVVDYDALYERLATGTLHAAIDVWPVEPIPADSPFRGLDNVVISAHRAGGIPEAFESIGEMVCDDLELMKNGLPPARMQLAAPELVGRYRNKPVG
ncbi:phosphoglycerate dehydrogenase-like enzyme [Homoserinimonas aerilata]|uniref:Phosphoglycerate dehydrogenase-like enzyme n=1 Tax=Homoserinimonas aerilata TaxID=1162970 RepID=A0A542YL89_9MICO|nr:hydroxyacid dehydrogenase [Homoserinimonas aerilata]TQL48855.1 phosphoglycerate dehydrogenase-like enzyme [Homoserinimonas aerilata]